MRHHSPHWLFCGVEPVRVNLLSSGNIMEKFDCLVNFGHGLLLIVNGNI